MRPRDTRGWLAAKVIKQKRWEAATTTTCSTVSVSVNGEKLTTVTVPETIPAPPTVPAPPIGAGEFQFSASASLSPEAALAFQRNDFCSLLPFGYALVWGLPNGDSCVCRVRSQPNGRPEFTPLEKC